MTGGGTQTYFGKYEDGTYKFYPLIIARQKELVCSGKRIRSMG